MRIDLLPLVGLFIFFLFVETQSFVVLSSGSGDYEESENDGIGSGSGDIHSTASPLLASRFISQTLSTLTDDEDIIISSGDKDQAVDKLGGSGPSSTIIDDVGSGGSGDLTTPIPTSIYMKCSDMYLYCWCVDEMEKEIPGTRMSVATTYFTHNCKNLIIPGSVTETVHINTETLETDNPLHTTPEIMMITDIFSTLKPLVNFDKTSTYKTQPPPYVVDADHDADGNTKDDQDYDITFVKPNSDNDDKPGEGVDHDGVFGDDDYNVVRNRIARPVSLFTHPGILAAVIGGGVVALLCALLLIMFIVYRMRKKDEGSYPLDATKPPRLHTYTRAPSKEIYA